MKIKFTILLAAALSFFFNQVVFGQNIVSASSAKVQSPDKNILVNFYQKTDNAGNRTMYYEVTYKGKLFISESALDLQMDNSLSEKAMNLKVDQHQRWCENLAVTKISSSTKDTTWVPVNGENSTIRDNYNMIDISLVKDDNPIYMMGVQIRAYNEGVAIRYYFPENVKGTYYNITAENTEFSLPAGTQAWFANWAQAAYSKLPLTKWPGESERPLTLELPNGLFATLAEAAMVDYARGKFKLSTGKPNTIVTSMFGEAELISPVNTPWRVIMIAEKPGDLVAHNYLMLNLNEPSKITNTSWIKPGKIMRVMKLNTKDANAVIDFTAQQKLQYILFDFGWYGNGYSVKSDASKIIPELDMAQVIKYAGEKGIGVWLYVNQQALFLQSDSLYSILKKWGIKGVKLGFVQVGSHRWTTWVEKNIQQAADNQLMVDIHDEWRPTGEQRTWPNIMTAEGVRGNEELPDATNNTILPFTRFIAGPADATFCYMDKRIKTTHAHQLALASIFFGPIQTLYWYDLPSQYHHEPELEFWNKLPTAWDESKVIQGTPGQYITTARRKDLDWFVGTITNNDARTLKIDLGFLPQGKKYIATIYSDDPMVQTATHVKIEHQKVSSSTVLTAKLLASGGQAIYITPEN
ncbi:MAG: alpha-glucosidase [Mucilaginibacter sp.]|nr:alpha-glucosidase [Mucilaginibacter sp.]